MDHHRRGHYHHLRVKRQVEETVFVTAKKTFSGPAAGFSTVGVKPSTTPPKPVPTPKTTRPQSKDEKPTPKATPKKTSTPTVKPTVAPPKAFTTSTSSSKPKSTATAVDDEAEKEEEKEEEVTIDVTSSSTRTFSTEAFETSFASNTLDSARETTATPTPTAISKSEESNGGGIGTYAGIVGGCVAGLLALLLIAAFIYRKRKQKIMNQAYVKPEEEKFGAVTGGFVEKQEQQYQPQQQRPSTAEKAPRLSLRPVTQFLPNLNSGPAPAAGPQNRPATQEVTRKPVPSPLNLAPTPAPAPVMGNSQPVTSNINSMAPIMPVAQPSPTLSAFSDGSSTIPGTPTSGVLASDPTPVYRIMMDFKPSQSDELELRAGNLVRLLHEYDDGWVLAVRMDRSQQGVCPRTCLSERPLQPKPRPGPGSAPGSPGGPNQQRRGPPRNVPPANSRPPYAMNPNRAQSPGPQNFPRPQSPANSQRQQRPQSPASGYRPQTPTQQQLPQIMVSPSPEASVPKSPPRSPPSAVNPTPQPKESSPLAQPQGSAFHAM